MNKDYKNNNPNIQNTQTNQRKSIITNSFLHLTYSWSLAMDPKDF